MPKLKQKSIDIPPQTPITYLVYANLPNGALPTGDQVDAIMLAWVARNVDEPFTGLVADVLTSPLVTLMFGTGDEIDRVLAALNIASLNLELDTDSYSHCIFIRILDKVQFPRPGLWAVLAGALALADHYGGVVVDGSAQRVFPSDGPFSGLHFDAVPRMQYFISTHGKEIPGRGYSVTTAGMDKFALPELRIAAGVPAELVEQSKLALLASCQLLFSMALQGTSLSFPMDVGLPLPYFNIALGRPVGAQTERNEAYGGIRLQLEAVDGDTTRNVITVAPPRPPLNPERFDDYGAWMQGLVNAWSKQDQAPYFEYSGHDAALQAAHERAMAELPGIKQRFETGELFQKLGLKIAFQVSEDANEYLWVAIKLWFGGQIIGRLVNEPQMVSGLHAGEDVFVSEDQIYDWLVLGPNGPVEGAYTDISGPA